MRTKGLDLVLGVAVVLGAGALPSAGAFDNAFDDATGHWMFGSDGTRLNDNNAPDTALSISWGGESPWGNDDNGFVNDKVGFTHLSGNGSHRLYVINSNAGELVFTNSLTAWTRIKWPGQASSISRLMGRHGGSPNWGWVLSIPGQGWVPGDATRAYFYLSSDGSTTLIDVNADYTFQAGAWYDVCGTFDHVSGDISVYVFDSYTGALLASASEGSSLHALNTPPEEFTIAYVGTDDIYVDIESAAVWARALSPAELKALTNWAPTGAAFIVR